MIELTKIRSTGESLATESHHPFPEHKVCVLKKGLHSADPFSATGDTDDMKKKGRRKRGLTQRRTCSQEAKMPIKLKERKTFRFLTRKLNILVRAGADLDELTG